MQRMWPAHCPACGQAMLVQRFQCPVCNTAVEGRFSLGRFAGLQKDHWDYLEVFLKCRGNLREVERELGLSYPTVRARLDDILAAMGLTPQGEVDREQVANEKQISLAGRGSRKEILAALERGEITPAQATEMLKNMRTTEA